MSRSNNQILKYIFHIFEEEEEKRNMISTNIFRGLRLQKNPQIFMGFFSRNENETLFSRILHKHLLEK